MKYRCKSCKWAYEDTTEKFYSNSNPSSYWFCSYNPKWISVNPDIHYCSKHSKFGSQPEPFGLDRS